MFEMTYGSRPTTPVKRYSIDFAIQQLVIVCVVETKNWLFSDSTQHKLSY